MIKIKTVAEVSLKVTYDGEDALVTTILQRIVEAINRSKDIPCNACVSDVRAVVVETTCWEE